MLISEYQEEAHKTSLGTAIGGIMLVYPVLGLAGEVGEFCNKLKKVWRDGTELDIVGAKKELGDCLWYLAEISTLLGLSMEEIAADNIAKLRSRQARNVLGGSGDMR